MTADLKLFFGHLHPLLVHLPIGWVVLLVILELLSRSARYAETKVAIGPVLLLAVPTSIASALCGWLLASSGGYDARLLQMHRWTGIVVTALCTLAALAHWRHSRRLYRLGLSACFGVLVVASHSGGSLTHGKDYFTRYLPAPLREFLDGSSAEKSYDATVSVIAERRAFEHAIKPMFDRHCVGCHGPEKAKAGLRLDSLQAALKGGNGGAVILPGRSAESLLVQRVSLPLDHEDRMPPAGRPQPTDKDLALLKWWVEAGASDKTIAELKPSVSIQDNLKGRLPGTSPLPETVPSQ